MKKLLVLLFLAGICLGQEGARYLIFTPDNFTVAVQPLADWKTKKGIKTKIIPLSQVGNSISQIRSYISNAYNNWQIRPEYILLVGMGNIMPYASVSDDYFADMGGVGNPRIELSVGRLPCRTLAQCQTIVNKILNYERTPYLADSLWFKKSTTIINEDGYGTSDTIYWRNARYMHGLWRNAGFVKIDSFSRMRHDSVDDVINSIDNGRTFLMYRGSTVYNWWRPFEINPHTTNNGNKLPIIVSATCATMSLIDQGYLGEEFVIAGSATQARGAVGFLGTTVAASMEGLANLRGTVATSFFHAIFEDNIYHLGDATKRAKNMLDSIRPQNYSDIRYREWNLFGDPEMPVWTSTPRELTVHHDTIITNQPQYFSVSVFKNGSPMRNALVCLLRDSLFYHYGYTDNQGLVSFLVYPQDSGNVSITVTAQNCLPYERSILVISNSAVHDVGAVVISDPQNIITSGAVITPKVLVRNFGGYNEPVPVTLQIGNIYNNTVTAPVNAGDTLTVTFPNWNAVLGSYPITTYTSLIGDQWRFNDTALKTVNVVAPNDVGVESIINPGAFHSINRTTIPKAKIRNYGTLGQSNFGVVCSIFGSDRTVRYTNSLTVSLSANRDTIVNFHSAWLPVVIETCNIKIATRLTGDENTTNDRQVMQTIISQEYCQDLEESDGNYIAGPLSGGWQWGVPTSGPNSAHSGNRCWATTLGGPYGNNANWTLTSTVFTASINNPLISFWHWFEMEEYYDGGNVKISTNNGASWTIISPISGYNSYCYTAHESTFSNVISDWSEVVFNLPVSAGQQFLIRWSLYSNSNYTGFGWYLDDIAGNGIVGSFPLANDMAIDSIIRPLNTQSVNVITYPIAMIKNHGIIDQINFPVTCTIIGHNTLRYTDTKTISLAAQRDTVIYFNQWYPANTEICTVKIRTGLSGDENSNNNSRVRQSEVLMLLLSEGFEMPYFPPGNWNIYNNDGGTQNWIRGTITAHSGTASAESRFEGSILRNDDWLVTAMIGVPTSSIELHFWYRAHAVTSYESLEVRLSTTNNLIPSFNILLDNFVFNNIDFAERVIPINGYAGQNVYIAFINKGLYRRKIYLDDILVKGFTDAIVENEANKIVPVTMLYSIRPNPIKNILARINFSLAQPSQVSLKIFDASGRLVKNLVHEHKNSGIYNITWNCRDDYNREVAEGVYFYTLETDKQSFTKKMILVK